MFSDTYEEAQDHIDPLMGLAVGAVQSVIGDVDHICVEEVDDMDHEVEAFGWVVKRPGGGL